MFRRIAAATGLAALALAASVPVVAAAGMPAVTAQTTPSEGVEESARMELVLDSSGSMAEDAQGGTRIDIAKESLHTVIDSLPDAAQVGLRVYGATIDTGPGSCEDSQQVVEIGADNRDELRAAVDGYTPLGETPIAYALQEAAKDLGDEGQRTIVLVSDGEPTCEPDPCVVAADLAAQGIDLKIDVVRLAVDAATRDKLACIAENGNGTYYDADDAESLTASLTRLSTRAFRPFEVSGIPVEGADEPAAATEIRADQQYVDTVPASEAPLYYAVNRTEPGSVIHFGTTVRSVVGGQAFMDSEAMLPDGTSCNREDGASSDLWGSRALLTTSVNTWSSDPEDPCNTAETMIFAVEQNQTDLGGAKFEIAVYEEPPLESDEGLSTMESGVEWQPMRDSEAQTGVIPGTSISDAPVLESGSYQLEILTGETQVFAVPLDWGQQLQFQAVSAPREGALDEAIQDTATLNVRAIGPVRETTSALLDIEGEPEWVDLGQSAGEGESMTAGGAVPRVSYLNRDNFDTDNAALPGYRFVEVNFSGGNDSDTFLLPYTLTVQVDGEAGAGAPRYADVEGLTTPVPPPAEMIVPASDESESDEDATEGPAGESGDDASSDDVDQASNSRESALPVVPLLLGAGGIVLLVAGGVVVARSMRRA